MDQLNSDMQVLSLNISKMDGKEFQRHLQRCNVEKYLLSKVERPSETKVAYCKRMGISGYALNRDLKDLGYGDLVRSGGGRKKTTASKTPKTPKTVKGGSSREQAEKLLAEYKAT